MTPIFWRFRAEGFGADPGLRGGGRHHHGRMASALKKINSMCVQFSPLERDVFSKRAFDTAFLLVQTRRFRRAALRRVRKDARGTALKFPDLRF